MLQCRKGHQEVAGGDNTFSECVHCTCYKEKVGPARSKHPLEQLAGALGLLTYRAPHGV